MLTVALAAHHFLVGQCGRILEIDVDASNWDRGGYRTVVVVAAPAPKQTNCTVIYMANGDGLYYYFIYHLHTNEFRRIENSRCNANVDSLSGFGAIPLAAGGAMLAFIDSKRPKTLTTKHKKSN